LSATREWRNACKILDAVDRTCDVFDEARDLARSLAAVLPDDFDMPAFDAAIEDAAVALRQMREVADV
jgi:hypothetical protein